jgi:hypothetical protein
MLHWSEASTNTKKINLSQLQEKIMCLRANDQTSETKINL